MLSMPVPPGCTPNFSNPPSKASWDVVTQAVCLIFATLLGAMRMYIEFKILRNPGWNHCERHIPQIKGFARLMSL